MEIKMEIIDMAMLQKLLAQCLAIFDIYKFLPSLIRWGIIIALASKKSGPLGLLRAGGRTSGARSGAVLVSHY